VGKVVVLTKVRIYTCLHLRCNVSFVKYVGSVDSTNCKLCCKIVRNFRESEFYNN